MVAQRFFNGLQIDVPSDWVDRSTVVLAPESPAGGPSTINLVVKRRPAPSSELSESVDAYLSFMEERFGPLEGLQTKTLAVGRASARAIRFVSTAHGRRFLQTTMLYRAGGDEISATVTQLEGDETSEKDVEKMLASVRPAASTVGMR
jgi:hypothetical protein